ncbi:MAG: response regulator transcription factor [Gemmatimonadetes bacterium]|nr:response regulator transcription factor [Gemmatimonadota bacterium]MBL0177667.1 response regulator transcription factor [Gemmatimonadota bacterium]
MRILLVEDDDHLATVIHDGLAEHAMIVTWAATRAEGQQRALAEHHDVLLLDVMLPGGSGFDLCRDLRTAGLTTPILMLTARDSVDDRVTGLDVGADDYLTKPFAFRELLARVRALARRPVLAGAVVRVADLEVDFAARSVTRGGRAIELTAKEFALLTCLTRHLGVVVDRAVISAEVWDDNHDPFTNVLEVLIRRLRRKLDDDFEPKLIHTLRGAGYRFGP